MKSKSGFLIFCSFVLLAPATTFAARSDYPLSISEQVKKYQQCVIDLSQRLPGTPWLDLFVACSARNDGDRAEQCLRDIKILEPNLHHAVGAMACAGGSKAVLVLDCMGTLYQKLGSSFDPSVSNSACSAGGEAAAAILCTQELMKKSLQDPFGMSNVTASILCSGKNTALQAKTCYESLVSKVLSDPSLSIRPRGQTRSKDFATFNTGLYEVYAAQACSGGNEARWASDCVDYARPHLKNLLGVSGQDDRTSSLACASSAIR